MSIQEIRTLEKRRREVRIEAQSVAECLGVLRGRGIHKKTQAKLSKLTRSFDESVSAMTMLIVEMRGEL